MVAVRAMVMKTDLMTPTSTDRLDGRICLVTGATSGLGAATARALARRGATVVVAGRDAARCAREVERIRSTGGRAEALTADLTSQAEVRRLADLFAARHPRLDVLVNNAGAYFMRRRVTVDGLEATFALNHLAPFLLTLLLLERLRASPAGRVVNVSSRAHAQQALDLEDLQGERRWDRLDAYGRSKLANLLFTYELARRLEGTFVTVNAVDPGLVATRLGSDGGWLRVSVRNLLRRGLLTPEQGARTIVHVAASASVAGATGRYYRDGEEARSSERSHDAATGARLWRASEALTTLRWADAMGRNRAGDGP
jgi:NAD(P)-dependent dehydrogenase (short-subunit alcohol dehydrogenase family)